MVHSSERKLLLSGWLQANGSSEYCSPFRLQKFLFFYEAMSKIAKDTYELDGLKGYIRGPVFSKVWGDYSKERDKFDTASARAYGASSDAEIINEERAYFCRFVVRAFNEPEVVEITHSMDIWARKKEQIEKGYYQVPLDEKDLTAHDEEILNMLASAFPADFINNSVVLPFGKKCFVFPREDYQRLTEAHEDVMFSLATSEADSELLENPVYAHIDEGGVMILD